MVSWMTRLPGLTVFLANLRNTHSDPTVDEIVEGLTTAAQWWEELLHATGGKLDFE